MDAVMITSFQVIAHVRMELVVSVFWILHHPGFILHQSLVIDTDRILKCYIITKFSHS